MHATNQRSRKRRARCHSPQIQERSREEGAALALALPPPNPCHDTAQTNPGSPLLARDRCSGLLPFCWIVSFWICSFHNMDRQQRPGVILHARNVGSGTQVGEPSQQPALLNTRGSADGIVLPQHFRDWALGQTQGATPQRLPCPVRDGLDSGNTEAAREESSSTAAFVSDSSRPWYMC